MSLPEFRAFATSALPQGGTLQQCQEDGTPLRRPGTLGPLDVATPLAADSEAHADIYRVRFDTTGTRSVSFLTTDPWKWAPTYRCWVIPALDDTGALVGWHRITPPGGTP